MSGVEARRSALYRAVWSSEDEEVESGAMAAELRSNFGSLWQWESWLANAG